MKKAAMVAVLALALSLALGATALAVTGVTGKVRDIDTKAGIAGAVVSYGTRTATTNSLGNYTLSLPAGAYTLMVRKAGYLTTQQVARVVANQLSNVTWSLTRSYPVHAVPAKPVSVLAWNDLGMHCDQDSYKYMMVLPPFNTLHVQLFGGEGSVGSAYTVSYSFAKKKDSTLHTDFWKYAPSFGFNLAPNVGLTGSKLSGVMKRDAKGLGWVAEGIPVTPYDDDGTWDPYGQATVTVKNRSGVTVATQNVVVPVSTEMRCDTCHGANPFVDVLTKHDASQGTKLLADAKAGKPHACAECHSDNALGMPGKAGIPSLSVAMHKRHDGKIASGTTGCYSCHPGPKTACLRGIMARAGKGCVDCHGTIKTVWTSAAAGRRPWLDMPKCATCHGSKYAENAGALYRNSTLSRSVDGDMNGRIYCEACHNGTHAEYATNNTADSVVTRSVQGDSYWIYNCQVCHKSGDSETKWRGQAMHR